MKILITEPEFFREEELNEFRKFGEVQAKKVSHNDLLNIVGDFDVLIIRTGTKIDKEVLEHAKSLKEIFSVSTNIEHIDAKYAESKGVNVWYPAGYATNSTAEHTFALLMSIARNIPWAFNSMQERKWERPRFLGKQLEGKTLGIIGLGRIGKLVAKYGHAFGMKIITYDPYITKEIANEAGSDFVTLEDLLMNSDFITINVALTTETENLINKNTLSLMKPTAMLINTSRGAVINETDLLTALKNKIIAGAALDVFANEPVTPDNSLIEYSINHDNLLITPHIGGSTDISISNATQLIVEKIKSELI